MRPRRLLPLLVMCALLIAAVPTAANHAEGTAFFSTVVGDAPAPTVGWQVHPDPDDLWSPSRTVATFEVPEEHTMFFLKVTEVRYDGVFVGALEGLYAVSPSGEQVPISNHIGGTSVWVGVCPPPAVSCTFDHHGSEDHPALEEREPGTYEIRWGGATTASYEVTAYGFPS